MNKRIDPFANVAEAPVFAPKPKRTVPVENETVERLAEQHNFPSRQAKPASAPRRKPRIHRTGRNQQFNAKATPETIQRFYKAADERRVPLGELLKQALDALDALEVIDPLQKIADRRKVSLQDLVSEAIQRVEAQIAAQ